MTEKEAILPQIWQRLAVFGAIYFLFYLGFDLAALPHKPDGLSVVPWNAAPAISFGLVVRLGSRWLPATFAAPLLTDVISGSLWADPAVALVRAVAEVMACALGGSLLRSQRTRSDLALLELDRLRAVFILFGAASVFAMLVASAESLTGVFRANFDLWKSTTLFGHVFLAYLVAILAITPLIFSIKIPRRWPQGRILSSAESLLQAAALAVIAWEVFGRFANEELHFFYLLFLPLTWIATRHGQPGSMLALAALYLAPLVSDRLLSHHDQVIVELQIRLVVLAVISLLLGALVSERKLSGVRMLARQAELTHFQRLNVGWEMASALAHELNQPLTAAMNYTQAALRLISVPTPDLDAASRIMAKSVDQIERVGQTIHGLRDFMRKGELRLAANNLGDVVEEAVRLVLAEANEAGVVLRSTGLAGLPPVMADKTQIVQVLVNLVRNAIQALAATNVKNPVVVISGRVVGGEVEVEVADNGPGLHPTVVAKLFEPFVTTKDTGMGLGLSISKSILEAHDGRLWAENASPENASHENASHGGAVFHFSLPLATKGNPDA